MSFKNVYVAPKSFWLISLELILRFYLWFLIANVLEPILSDLILNLYPLALFNVGKLATTH